MKLFSNIFKEKLNGVDVDGNKLVNFWNHSQHYPTLFTNGHEDRVWPKVHKAISKENKNHTELMMSDGNIFTFVVCDPEYDCSGNSLQPIELYYNKNIICALNVVLRRDNHVLHSVEFIKDGEWKKDIVDFELWKSDFDKRAEQYLDKLYLEELAQKNHISKFDKTLDD
jgi:hypothetical protein